MTMTENYRQRLITILMALLVANYLAWLLHTPMVAQKAIMVFILCVIVLLAAEASRRKHYAFPLLLLLGLLVIVGNPVVGYDGRCIWFFHAKRMFFDGSLQARFDNYIPYLHNDYPDMIPSLAASVALLFGVWNEYLPKLAIVIGLIAPVMVIAGNLPSGHLKYLGFGFILIGVREQFLDGYMDGFLALYAASALVLLQISAGKQEGPGLLAMLMLAATCSIKNEGIPLALLMIFSYLVLQLGQKPAWKKIGRHFALLMCTLLPALIWKLELYNAHMVNDLIGGNLTLAQRIHNRFAGGGWWLIIRSLLGQTPNTLCILTVYVSLIVYLRLHAREAMAWMTVSGYFIVLFIVYMATPLDLTWHLNTSVSRVVMPINLILLLGILRIAQYTDFGRTNLVSLPIIKNNRHIL